MRLQPLLLVATIAAVSAFAPASRAQSCVGFTDVAVGDSFCSSVEWIKNRDVTLGCSPALGFPEYCPFDNVTRAQMALFMHRLGKALTPVVLHREQSQNNVTVGPGEQVICETADFTVAAGSFPRLARFNGTVFAHPTSPAAWLQGWWKYSTDAGTTWNYPGNWLTDQFMGRDWAGQAQVAGFAVLAPPLALLPGTTYRFGIFVNGYSQTYTFNPLVCQAEVTIQNANPAVSPLDE